MTAAFVIPVWGGVMGALLLRKKWAKLALLISLIGIFAQMGYSFFMTRAIEVYGQIHGIIMPLLVIVVGFALVFLALLAHMKNWLF